MEATVIRDYTGKDSAEAIAQLEQDGFRPVVIGEGGKIMPISSTGRNWLKVRLSY